MSELKSAYELAMERLRKKDAEAGVEHKPPTDEQKTAIAEVRRFYEARLAQQQVLQESSMRKLLDPDERAKLEDDYRREREKIIAELDEKIDRLRRG